MSASDTERREELAQLYPDVMRIAAGMVANEQLMSNLASRADRQNLPSPERSHWLAGEVVAWAIAVVQAGRRRCFEDEPAETGGAA